MLKPIFSSDRLQPLSRLHRDSHGLWGVLDAFDTIGDVLNHPWPGYRFGPTEDGAAYSVVIELPGYKREHVTVEVVDDDAFLHVSTSKPSGKVGEVEYALGTSIPYIAFPSDADSTKVSAKLEDGLLTVTVPKVAAPAPRKVVVS